MVPGGLLGGDSRSSEKSRIRKGLGIIVATPGRLLDHLHKTESLLLNLKGKLQWLVLDEADRLLDMGLGDQVKQIVQLIRANEASKSQPWWRSILVSATVSESVKALAKERMLCGDQSWVWVKGGGDKATQNSAGVENSGPDQETKEGEFSTDKKREDGYSDSTPRQLAQFHITVTAKLRLSTLVSFLTQRVSKGERTVVFMGTCACVDFHHKLFQSMEPLWEDDEEDTDNSSKNGLFGSKAQVFKLHGNVQHSKRNQTLKLFDKAVGGAILLSTDVSARGLNLEGIDWSVQYDPPCEIGDYVHRVGRVARAGKAGRSLLFLLPSEKGYLDVLQTKGISKVEPLSLATTLNTAASYCQDWTNAGLKYGGNKEINGRSKGSDNPRGSRLGEHFAGEIQRRLEECIVQDQLQAQKKWKEEKKANKKRNKNTPSKGKEGELMELARDAFLSFLRAYATKKEPSVRSIFSARALHVGHVARSFALKDPPKSLISKHKQSKQANSEMEAADQQANRPKSLQFNAYENNLVSLSDDEADVAENDGNDHRSRPLKRPKLHGKTHDGDNSNSKGKNARTQLLQNAMKMQNNLMDAM
jgi:ATP-dependent RNA helicase DDX31/DBP7